MVDEATRSLFPAVPRPDQVVTYAGWRAALSQVEGALGRAGVIAVVGDPGMGKTLLLQVVATRLRAGGRTPMLLQHKQTSLGQEPDVILIDDADRLTASLLKALVRHGRPVIVGGTPGLADRLQTAGLVATVVTLGVLTREECAEVLAAQLAAAGQRADLIQPAAVMRLFEVSQGVPRNLQMLAGLSVFMARLGDGHQVLPAHVDQAALIQHGTDSQDDDVDVDDADEDRASPASAQPVRSQPAPQPARRVRGWAMAMAVAVLAAGAVGSWLLFPHPPAKTMLLASAGSPTPAPMPLSPVELAAPRLASLPAASEPGSQPRATLPLALPPQPAASEPVVSVPVAPTPQEVAPTPEVSQSPRPTADLTAAAVTAAASLPALASPAPGAPPLPLPLPAPVPVHVVVAFDTGSADAGPRAAALANELRRLGYPVAPPEAGAGRGEPAVSYVFLEDAPAAMALAHALGLEATQVRSSVTPRPGTIRVAVASAPTGRVLVNLQHTGAAQ